MKSGAQGAGATGRLRAGRRRPADRLPSKMNELIQKIAVYALPVLFAITVHEASHGYVARMFGDTTAFVAGRVSLNPLKHIDPIGTIVVPAIMLLLSGMMFGWAKPVPVNFGALRHPKRDMIWVAAAGPMSNLVMAIIWTLFLTFQQSIGSDEQFFQAMALAGVQVNLIFMALNLLPIPPLDGGRILVGLLPNALAYRVRAARTVRLLHRDRPHGARRARILPGPVPRTRHGDRRPVQLACAPTPCSNRRVLSGMRPTGALHIGHYHGALKNWVKLQDEHPCFFFVADWHALTTHYESPEVLAASVWDMLIDWFAAGVDPQRATVFIQSRVPEHAELFLLLSMATPLGWLERVPTYKDQIEKLGRRTSRPTASSAIR